MKKRGVKGQVTLFIILGLVLLIVIFGLIALVRVPTQSDTQTQSVPEEFKPVSNYIQACIHQVALEGVRKMGSHGGYIEPLDKTITPNVLKYFSSDQTRGDLASFTGLEDSLVPYYVHVPGIANYNNYQLSSSAPTIENMQVQLAAYVKRELPLCTGSFESLETQGFEVDANPAAISARTVINDNVEVYVQYPVNVTREGERSQVSSYSTMVNVPLKDYYETAMTLAQVEFYTQYQESFALSLINYYSGLDMQKLPPFRKTTDLPFALSWSNSKTRLDMNSLLLSYVPALQVANSSGFAPLEESRFETEIEKSFYNSLVLDVFNQTLNESVTFFYKDQSLKMKVQPSKRDIIKPSIEVNQGNRYIPQSRINTYEFYYDVSYPVFVEVRARNAASELPEFSFVFAMEANIIENKPAFAWELGYGTVEWDTNTISTTITLPDGSITDEDGNELVLEPFVSSKSLFCDEDAWISGEISAKVTDEEGNPLDDVSVAYSCGEQDSCAAGQTASDGTWASTLPLCQGGYFTISKEGYGVKRVQLSTSEEVPDWLGTQVLSRIRTVTGRVVKLEIDKIYTRDDDWVWSGGVDSIGLPQELSSSEQVSLAITQVDAGEDGISQSVLFGKEGVSESELQLVPGVYSISAPLIDYAGFSIPAGCDRVCDSKVLGLFGCDNYIYYPDEAIDFGSIVWGGVEIGSFTITAADLDKGNIEFKVLKLPDLSQSNPAGACVEGLEEMDLLDDYYLEYANEIKPSFS